MPKKTDQFPGSWISTLDWDELANGDVWVITADEMEKAEVKLETVRVYAHNTASLGGFKFRTRNVDGDLYLQRKR